MWVIAAVGMHLFPQLQPPPQKMRWMLAGAINPNGTPRRLKIAPALETTLHFQGAIPEIVHGPFPCILGGTAAHSNERPPCPRKSQLSDPRYCELSLMIADEMTGSLSCDDLFSMSTLCLFLLCEDKKIYCIFFSSL